MEDNGLLDVREGINHVYSLLEVTIAEWFSKYLSSASNVAFLTAREMLAGLRE